MPRGRPKVDAEAAFWLKVDKSPEHGGCWLWTAAVNEKGYGLYHRRRVKIYRAHRWAWFFVKGELVPDDMTLDHICRNKRCVNPAHLEVVTAVENTRRAIPDRYVRITHCRQGHQLSGDNVLWRGRTRHCRTCRRIRAKESRKPKDSMIPLLAAKD